MPSLRLTSPDRSAANTHVLADFADVGRLALVCVLVAVVTPLLVAAATN
jgi:hypothetical protein